MLNIGIKLFLRNKSIYFLGYIVFRFISFDTCIHQSWSLCEIKLSGFYLSVIKPSCLVFESNNFYPDYFFEPWHRLAVSFESFSNFWYGGGALWLSTHGHLAID